MAIISDWLSKFSANTKDAYNHDIHIFQKWMKKHRITLNTITLGDVRRWGRTVGTSPADRRLIGAVKSFLKHAFNQEYTTSNVGRCLNLPKKNSIRIERNLTKDQCTLMIEKAEGETKLFLQVLFYLGVRLSEARQLKRSDVHKRTDGCLVFNILGKGGKQRSVVLGPKTSLKLQGEILSRSGYLFPGRSGSLSRSGAGKRVAKAMKCIVPASSAHWMRHAHATVALQNGADLATVSKSLGHSSVGTTSAYLHSNPKGASAFLE